ncbi:MAG: helix-turn-helix transcriptional regulator [Synergistaceae bacterium]|nr:helix-turn-helix transcriptional regulator [Synergistaceae bacterium]
MYATDFAQVGANIQERLQLKGMSQQELANALSISKQVMNKIIKGYKAINVNELARIASILGVTTDSLLLMSDDVNSANDRDLSFMGKISDIETRQKVDLIRSAIDEIHLLEELVNG